MINEEYDSWKKYGRNGRNNDQIIILKTYQALLLEGSTENFFLIRDALQVIYNKITIVDNVSEETE